MTFIGGEPNDAFFHFHFIKVKVKEVILVGLKMHKKLESHFMKRFLTIAKARRPRTYDRFGVSILKIILMV
jgi:hypothetical protein